MLCRTCGGRVAGGAPECPACYTPAGAYALRHGRRTYPVRTAGLVASALVGLSTAVAVAADLAPPAENLVPGTGYRRLTADAEAVALLVAAPAVLVWFQRAYRNLGAFSGVEPAHRSGWAIAGWFVPVVNVYLPHSMMAEIADHSLWRDRVRHLVPVWWLAWLTGLVAAAVVRSGGPWPLAAAALVLNTVAGGVLIALMLRVSRAQEARIVRGAGPPPPLPGLIMTSPVVPVTEQRDRRPVPDVRV